MIDIHTHIIPAVDDGSQDLSTSLELLKQEVEQGITKVVLTPHMNFLQKDIDLIKKSFMNLKEKNTLQIELLLGSEIKYYQQMINDLKDGKLLTIDNSKYVLIEFDFINEENTGDIIYELIVAGYKPIIAHIERYRYLNSKDYINLKQEGALIQINASSIKHRIYRKRIKQLLKKDLVDFVASDCHNLDRRNVDFTLIKKFVLKHNKKSYDKVFKKDFKFHD